MSVCVANTVKTDFRSRNTKIAQRFRGVEVPDTMPGNQILQIHYIPCIVG